MWLGDLGRMCFYYGNVNWIIATQDVFSTKFHFIWDISIDGCADDRRGAAGTSAS
jgi:hypothetical protein